MRVLIVRPEPQASRMAAVLGALGIAADVAPLLTIRPLPRPFEALAPGPVQALLVSSPAGGAALADLPSWVDRETPVVAVGRASAAAVRGAGFAEVEEARGDAAALAAAAARRFAPAGGRLVHVAGRHRAGDVAGALAAAGFSVEVVVAYEAEAADALPAAEAAALAADAYDAVVLASARTAEALARSWVFAGLPAPVDRPVAVAIAAAAADPVRDLFRRQVVADRPDGESLTAAVVALRHRLEKNGPGSGTRDGQNTAPPGGQATIITEEGTAMASETDQPGRFDPKGRRKGKPSSTIDLTATEVSNGPRADEGPDPADAPAAAATPDVPVSATEPVVEAAPSAGVDPVSSASGEIPPADAAADPAVRSGDAPAADETPAFGSGSGSGSGGPPPAAARPAEPARGGSGLSAIAAALLGGVVVLGGGIGLMASGLLDPYLRAESPAEVAALEGRLADLDTRLAAVQNRPAPPAPGPDPVVLERLSAVEAAVRALPTGPAGPDPAVEDLKSAVAELKTSLDDAVSGLAQRVDAVDAKPVPADPTARLDALASSIEALKAADAVRAGTLDELSAAARRPVADPARVDALQATVDSLGQRLAGLDTTLTQRFGALDGSVGQRFDALNTTVGELSGRVDAAVADVRGGLDSAVKGVRADAETAISGLKADVAPLGDRLKAVEDKIASEPAAATVAAFSLAVTTLASKAGAGDPFATDLAVVKQTGEDLPDVSALEANAETGVATTADLQRTFPTAAILRARPMDPTVGVWDRVVDGAKSLVNYREAGETSADPLSAPLDATEKALAAGDLPAAQAAWDTLPDWAKTASADWKTRLDAKVAVDAAVKTLTDQTMSRLQPQTGETTN